MIRAMLLFVAYAAIMVVGFLGFFFIASPAWQAVELSATVFLAMICLEQAFRVLPRE